jgi:uncharacterized protein YwgA
MPPKHDSEKVAAIIRDAGGKIVGRTRLQKTGYLLELAGLGEGFPFEYRHYGPYSEELAAAARDARALGLISEKEHRAGWGGFYSIFTSTSPALSKDVHPSRLLLVRETTAASAIALELAATAAFLAREGSADPWGDTARFKPDKAQGGRLENARALYQRLQQIDTPKPLPRIT